MKLVVMKFGGTSVGSIDKINNVANIIEKQLNNKKLISQASLASMTLPNSGNSAGRNMKGFVIACKLEAA